MNHLQILKITIKCKLQMIHVKEIASLSFQEIKEISIYIACGCDLLIGISKATYHKLAIFGKQLNTAVLVAAAWSLRTD